MSEVIQGPPGPAASPARTQPGPGSREIRPIFGGRGAQKRSHHSPRAAMAAPVSSTINRPVRMM